MKSTLTYRCAGQTVVNDESERSILDVSVTNKIPHWRECGGNARCTTCRVQIYDGLANLSARTAAEQALADARDWSPAIRLACQTRVRGDVTLERLVRSGAEASQLQLETVGPDAAEERTLAMLFCDMREFTSFAESHSAFDVVHILNRLFAALGEPILLNGGVIYQYVGDEISGLFGLDGSTPESTCLASVRAALAMHDALAKLNAELEREFQLHIDVGIGVHYGPVILGHVGHPTRRQFSVVGDNVNMASRIQSMNKALDTNILVSDAVMDHLSPGTIEISKVTSERLRGKQEPVRLHAVSRFIELDDFFVVQRTLAPLLDGGATFANTLYARIFKAAPELEAKFVNGVEAQGQMLEHMLRSVVFGLGRSNHVALGLHALGAKHMQYQIEPEHYAIFQRAMIATIADILGPETCTPRVANAWANTIEMMVNLMQTGAARTKAEPE